MLIFVKKIAAMKMLLVITVLLSGLMAGLLYAYSCSVNLGLKMLSDSEYIRAMQAINKAIENPLFFSSFLGLLIVFPAVCYQLYGPQSHTFYLMLVAMGIYVIGVFGITLLFNVPLNNQLANFSLQHADSAAVATMRQAFEKPWNTFHTVRTVAAIVSFLLAILSLLNYKS
jgi:uncharacterized membrane protein